MAMPIFKVNPNRATLGRQAAPAVGQSDFHLVMDFKVKLQSDVLWNDQKY